MSDQKLRKPARKLRTRDISKLEQRDGSWFYCQGDLSFSVEVVWIQGTIVGFNQDRSEVIIKDDGVDLTVTGCNSIPGGTSWIERGNYVMVVGELESGSLNIRTIKMANLSDNPVHKDTWNNEVVELKALMRENKAMCR